MLRGVFLEELTAAMLDRDWVLLQGTRYYGVLRETSLEGWTRVTSSGIADELRAVRNGTDQDRMETLERLDADLEDDGSEDEG